MTTDIASQHGIACTWMRGGTSKGAYFLNSDLPTDQQDRDQLLLAIMGSPDPRQIDGIGGADPLTSKVAVISPSARETADIDYLFLQVIVDKAVVTDAQNCGNILAGVGQFAVERGLVKAVHPSTTISVYMVNSDQVATVTIDTPENKVSYTGNQAIDGVPGTAAPVLQNFPEAAGSSCGALLPTGEQSDVIDGVELTCIDNGMPVVILRAQDFDITGYEPREQLDANNDLKSRIERLRLRAGELMNLGDVSEKTVPKITLVAAPQRGGTVCTRTFIPHRCHASIGVLGAVSVATACVLPASVTAGLTNLPTRADEILIRVEHPIGEVSVVMEIDSDNPAGNMKIHRAAIVRTARKLFEGRVFPNSY